jgi:hypothetical protein
MDLGTMHYSKHKEAETLTAWLDGWIEAVLWQQRRGKGTPGS